MKEKNRTTLKHLRIAIDGGAATGKSSVSKEVANLLGLDYLNTGDLYRIVALYVDKKNLTLNEEKMYQSIGNLSFSFINNTLQLENFNYEYAELHTAKISQLASKIATFAKVRSFLLDFQINVGKQQGVLLEGRDIGTKIMIDADLKFFLTVSNEEGAKRRHAELSLTNPELKLETVKVELATRNTNDQTRVNSPFVKAVDALEIDTSSLTKVGVVELIINLIKERFNNE